jgi:hypothetical protein
MLRKTQRENARVDDVRDERRGERHGDREVPTAEIDPFRKRLTAAALPPY